MEQNKKISEKVQKFIELANQKGDTKNEREDLLRNMTPEEAHELCETYIGNGNGSRTCKACLMSVYNGLHTELMR